MKKRLLFSALGKGRWLLHAMLVLLSFSAIAQDPPQYGTPFSGVPDPRDVNMYQVHTRIFSTAGNLQGVISRLDQIRALGINTIYLMPHYPVGTDARSSGSPYCIKDFKGVGAEYGSLTDLRQLVDGAHTRGMAVILDFVVNQTSFDHPWITQHPDWYLKDGSGNIVALYPDVAALDLNNTTMRAALIDAMRYWVFAANVDGFRYDFANNPSIGFWSAVISNLRGISSHKLLLFAEGDRPENFQAGFDLNFGDKFFWDALRPVSSGTAVTQLQATTNVEYSFASSTQQVVRYTTNHDLVGRNDVLPFQVFQNHNGVVANFLVCAYMRGVPFLMSGQEVDFSSFVAYPWYNPKINWGANTGAAADFTKILNFRTSSAAIRRGAMTDYSNTNVCAFTKVSGTEKVVVMANLRNGSAVFTIPAAMAGTYKDAYTGGNVTLSSGATQSLTTYQYIVLTNAGAATVPVTGVSVSPTAATLNAGTTTQLTATVAPSDATNKNVSWSSNNGAVATVSASGLVTAIAAGTAVITATTQDGNKTATSTITVNPASNFTVHFYKPAAWGTGIKIYWWNALPTGILADATWPGVNMTSEGNGWYSYTFTNISSTNLIFNDGANQTADLSRNKNGWYMNNTWYDANPGTPSGTTYYQIVNRWQASSYLYDAGNGQVRYGTNPGTNNAYQWSLVDAGSGYVKLKNRATGNFMHVENQNGSVQCGAVNADWYSGMWMIAAATDGWSYLQNRWQPTEWINIEGLLGYAQYSGAQAGWYSAMWKLVNPVSARQAETLTPSIVHVFPNPVKNGIFYVDVQNNEPITVVIRDIHGRAVISKKGQGIITFDNKLTPGVYMIQMIAKQKTVNRQLVVQ